MDKKKFFISTAIDYPSEKPHLGHCLEKIQADVIARYKRFEGFNVHFSVGTDEHGQKIQRYACKSGKKPQEFVDEMSVYFKNLWDKLNISYDDFIRTTEKRHEKVVEQIIKTIYKKGDIYKGKYKGLYCVNCETFYLPRDLENGNCPIHHNTAEEIEEETYFLRMSKYQGQLRKYIKKNKGFILPESKKNEILNRLKEPLQDLSISRQTVEWGIPFPIEQRMSLFVWVDALINYLTTIDYPNNKFKKFWPADIHIIGKDIVWHHSIIWVTLLLSLGLSLPKKIFVHGFITSGGQKMSKSLGNVVDPFESVSKYGTDAVRYYLLREFSPFEDGDYTEEKFRERYNADLANGLGNLVARVVTLGAKLKINHKEDKIRNRKLEKLIRETEKKCGKSLEEFKFNEALAEIWSLISFCDKYINETKPWEDKKDSAEVIQDLMAALREIAALIKPFLPQTSEKVIKQIETGQSNPLFPRLDKDF